MSDCKETIEIGDDYGDGGATMTCQLPEGHEGEHQEKFTLYGQRVTVQWGSQ